MAITVYRSTDTSAPTLTGQAGSLITLLDAVLVNGYGSKAAAGWTKAYSGTNKAAYRLGSGTQFYLRVVDDGTTSAAYGRILGYESMSDVDTGTNGFPTNVQVSGGLYAHKSSTADSTARPWMIIACDRGIYFIGQCGQTTFGAAQAATDNQWFFGDLKSYKTGDGYQCHIVASTSATLSGASTIGSVSVNTAFSATTGHYVARAHTQITGAVATAKTVWRLSLLSASNTYLSTNTLNSYPNPITGGIDVTPLLIAEPTGGGNCSVRGQLPGAYDFNHSAPAGLYDTFDGTGTLSGVSFIIIPITASTTATRMAVQTSGTWY
jgi:hypothetical protein